MPSLRRRNLLLALASLPCAAVADPKAANDGFVDLERDLDGELGLAPSPGQLLTASTARTMFTPVSHGYALGFQMRAARSSMSFGHGGANHGCRNAMLASVDGGEGIVVMTNGEGGDGLARALIRAVSAEYGWPAYEP